ncbi:centromere-associated protein E isoform X2 [Nannospalax galili]|uniref:centromere-associated protein E isoform X2 n=1 Tax=Nannospalax galili TaxID=1026970 RepID=UPI00111C376D|nr:centromere-associated protein E isoform X2 [Nannospalax galili]
MAEEAAVAVCVRVRPLPCREELGEDTHVYWKTDNNAIYQIDGSKSFNFDRVFHSSETTKNVYEEIAVPIIDSAIQGYNGTIFAYGQTASGKTHTMMGSEDCLGVIPRAIHDIFEKIKKFPEREFLLRVSYMEIYNETITDLLCNAQKMKPLIIREDINRNVYVADLTEEVVYTSEMALKWISKGEKNRHYGVTKMNQRSSRSHTIFRMILESREKGESSNCEGSIKVSHLNLVDLAGSERAAQTGAEGVRLKEGCNINRSLFILGQVIKKLSDGQIGGFINYRDSKLTRILQNSLGGNAKTRIICTITPVSFDETLTTLQFASTAKYMKNTPYVNEVSSDEALLKRYRKEIVDLKKQLEEVNMKTRAQEMEKDQLAQLLDEKDLLQKVQDEKIQNLKRMLVTSSSITLQQELKAKKKRRVTWCVGKINKMKESHYESEFKMPTNVTTRSRKTVTVLGETDESLCFDSDIFSNTLEPLTEIEWNSATKLLSEEHLESELNSLHAKYDNLVLDYEQLRRENEDLGLKLKEKSDLDEFEALERKAEKDQEMQLIHEISNLKNLVKHAEVYNQDLENELSSKIELLKEKDDQIKTLQKCIDSQKSENMRADLSYASENTEDLKQIRQTLFDAETVALDAKRESAFLRSENLELKEKMNELSNSYKQMKSDIQLYQSQLEAKKKMQMDLDKELQSAFNEITKLTALIDGRVPKDLLSNLELEKRITELQRELNEEAEGKETLRKEVQLLSELKCLPSEVEMLRKELHEKSEELYVISSERERLLSEVAHKDSRIQGLLEEIGRAEDDLAASQPNYKSSGEECQALKILHTELEQKYEAALEENERMKQEVGNLSREAESLGSSVDSLKTELSHKTQELQQKTAESQERLNEVQQLKAELASQDCSLRSVEKENTLLSEKLQHSVEEVRALTREKDGLKQLQESLRAERDQLRSDIQDTVNMNIDTQEQLLNALESLKQHQETISTLTKQAEEPCGSLRVKAGGGRDEVQQEKTAVDERQNLGTTNTQRLIADAKDDEGSEQQKISSLIQERNELQQMLESVRAEKEQLKRDLKENIEMTVENQEELRILRVELRRQQEIVAQERSQAVKKGDELSRACERLAEAEEELREKNQKLQEKQQQLRSAQEELTKMQEKINEMENLKNELKNQKLALEHVEMERLELTQKLQENDKKMKSITKERNDLKELQESFEVERNQLKEYVRETEAMDLRTKEELIIAPVHLKKHQEIIDELQRSICERDAEAASPRKDTEKPGTELHAKESLKIPEAGYKQEQSFNVEEKDSATAEMSELGQLKEMFKARDSAVPREEQEEIRLSTSPDESGKVVLLAKERDGLQRLQQALQSERDQLTEHVREITAKHLETEEELKAAHCCLKEQEKTIDALRMNLSQKEAELSSIRIELESATDELQKKLQELQEKEHKYLEMKTSNETEENMCEMEHLKEQFEAQKSTLEKMEMQNVTLTQRLHENTEEMRSVTRERDDLRSTGESLKVERDQLKENLKATMTRGLEKEEELRISHLHLKEHQETIDKLKEIVSEKTDEISNIQGDLERTNATLEAQIQELQEKEHQFSKVKGDLREAVYQMEQLKEQMEAQNSTLESIKIEKLRLTQKLHENLEEVRLVTKENDGLRLVEETLRTERDQLRESLRKVEADDLKKEEKLRIVHVDLKEHRETIDRLRGIISEKTEEASHMKTDLGNADVKLQAKIQELKANELQLLKLKGDMNEMQRQLKEQGLTLNKIEMENLNLAQKLHETLQEMKSVVKERDNVRRAEEMLKHERDRLEERLREAVARDHQNHKELVKHERRLSCDAEHLTESLREKCLRINVLLKRYSEMDSDYECLDRLSLDLEKEIETQKELSVTLKANLSLPCPQAKEIQKLLSANQRCSMEFHRVMKKLKYVLSHVTKIKEEQHDSINKFEMAFIQEVEKQSEFQIKIQCLQQDYEIPSRELEILKLNQNMDLHIEEILKDFSGNDLPSIKTEFQQVLSNRKEMTQFLKEWLHAPFDVEKLKSGIQKENTSICQVNNFYNSKIAAIVNESTEFEERNATRSKEWEHDLKSMNEKTKKLFKDYQALTVSLSTAHIYPAHPSTQSTKNPCVASGVQLTAERIQELETSLQEAKESAMYKEDKIVKMQKELDLSKDVIAELQTKVRESNTSLEKAKESVQVLQDKVALGAMPYKEEIEDLKTKLVKVDLEKKKSTKEYEKEILSTKATVEHQKEVIRLLRENLRRTQQTQDTSMITEHDSQPLNKPLTCGGGSGIVQSTKALILKSEYIRLEKEVSKLKQQNEQLIKQKNELLSENHHLSKEIKTWKEGTLKREAYKEAACANSPKSPKVTGSDSKWRQNTAQCRARNLQGVPKESPKSLFFDSRSKSLPGPHPVRYFDNSSLGLCPEEQAAEAENVDPKTDSWCSSSGKEVPPAECKMQ